MSVDSILKLVSEIYASKSDYPYESNYTFRLPKDDLRPESQLTLCAQIRSAALGRISQIVF